MAILPVSEKAAVPCRCPLAAPTGAALHSTKRGLRYWRLRSAVAAAVARAGSLGSEAGTPAQQGLEPPPLPSKLEVWACMAQRPLQHLAKAAQNCTVLPGDAQDHVMSMNSARLGILQTAGLHLPSKCCAVSAEIFS